MCHEKKFLFMLFTNDLCRLNHALMYALELSEHEYSVKIIIEGAATQFLNELTKETSPIKKIFLKILDKKLFAGICDKASQGCSTNDPKRDVQAIANQYNIPLLNSLNGHSSPLKYIQDNYTPLVF